MNPDQVSFDVVLCSLVLSTTTPMFFHFNFPSACLGFYQQRCTFIVEGVVVCICPCESNIRLMEGEKNCYDILYIQYIFFIFSFINVSTHFVVVRSTMLFADLIQWFMFRAQILGVRFRAQGLGVRFRAQGLGFRFRGQELGLGLRVLGLGLGVTSQVQDLGFMVQVQGFGVSIQVYGNDD